MDGSFGDGLAAAFKMLVILCCIFIPLGMWKVIEIAVWLLSHLRVV